jgi:hypothetical protein
MSLFFRLSVLAFLFFSQFAFAGLAPVEQTTSDISPDGAALYFIQTNWPWIVLAVIGAVVFAKYVSKVPH